MAPIILHSPFELPWQTVVFDALMLTLFVTAVAHAVLRHRRGVRIYGFVLVAGLVYGMVLELAGMATLNMYIQGDFPVMINFPALPLFAGTTAMPLYVTLFYPVIFTMGFLVVEALGIPSHWRAALTGGLFMIFLDAPYIIEGNLRNIVWWTWDPHFVLFQYWLGWPLADMFWQSTWGATFFYVMLRCRAHLDGDARPRWSTRHALAVRAPLAAIAVLALGMVWMLPLLAATFTIGQQWPVLVVLVLGLAVVTVQSLRSATPARRVDPFMPAMIGIYVLAFLPMIVANVLHDGVRFYAVVQTLGLIGMLALATLPLRLNSANRSEPRTRHAEIS